MDARGRGSFELENHLDLICLDPSPPSTNPKRSTAFLDGVRGLAAFLSSFSTTSAHST